jgi:hypothetical protein
VPYRGCDAPLEQCRNTPRNDVCFDQPPADASSEQQTESGAQDATPPSAVVFTSRNGFSSAVRAPITLSCDWAVADLLARDPLRLTAGTSTIVVGVQPRSETGTARNAMIIRIDGGKISYCSLLVPAASADMAPIGMTWDGMTKLYVDFEVTGAPGPSIESATALGWMPNYGDSVPGDGSSAILLGILDPMTGALVGGTFVESRNCGNTTPMPSCQPTQVGTMTTSGAPTVTADGNIELSATSGFCPLNPDKTTVCDPQQRAANAYAMLNYQPRFSADLKTMVCATAADFASPDGIISLATTVDQKLVKMPCQ